MAQYAKPDKQRTANRVKWGILSRGCAGAFHQRSGWYGRLRLDGDHRSLVLAFFVPGRESAGQGHGPALEGEDAPQAEEFVA